MTEITIDKKPFSTTDYYGGEYQDKVNEKVHKFTLTIFDGNSDVTWLEDDKPYSHKQVELDIIKQFQRTTNE